MLQRLAVLRFENLSSDLSLDWMGRAAPEVVAFQLTGANGLHVITLGALHGLDRVLGPRPASAPGISTEVSEAMAAGATRVLYGQISRPGDRLRIDATLYDARAQRVERTAMVDGPASDGILPLADALVKQLGGAVRPFDTRSEVALREYTASARGPRQRENRRRSGARARGGSKFWRGVSEPDTPGGRTAQYGGSRAHAGAGAQPGRRHC